MVKKEKIDLLLSKWVSRKLSIIVVASIALFAGNLTSSDWTIIATMYVGIEGATTIVERLMRAKKDEQL
jgi:hypothetical protein